MTLNKTFIAMLVSAVIGAALTKYYYPNIESKTVEIEKEVIKNNIVTIVKTITKPDGTTETISETTDKSTKKETSRKEAIVVARKDWMIGASASTKFSNLEPIYGAQVQRRILGPFYLGATASTDKTVGVSLGFEF